MLNWKHVHCICGKLTFADKIWLGSEEFSAALHFDHEIVNTTLNPLFYSVTDGDNINAIEYTSNSRNPQMFEIVERGFHQE